MAFPTTGVLDNFNRADTGPPPSANWTGNWAVTTGGDTLVVVSNQLAATASGDAYWNVATFGPDSEAFCTVVTLPGLSFRLAVRLTSITNTNGYQLRVDPGAGNIVFGRLDTRVVTQLGASLTQDLSNGNKAGLEMIGSTLSYYHDVGSGWAFVDSRSDATYSTAGNIGVRINDTTGILDDFGGGTVVATAPSAPVYPGGQWMPMQTTPGLPAFAPLQPSYVEQNALGYQQPLAIQQVLNPLIQLSPGLPGFTPLQPTGVEQNAIGYVTPLPISQFVNPLSLVMGPVIFPIPVPYYPPNAADVTISAPSGNLVLSAGVATPAVAGTPSVGNLVLAAGTATPAVAATPAVGNLVLAAGTATPKVTTTPSVGNLVLSAGTATPAASVTPPVGNLVLSAGVNTPLVAITPPVGNLVLSGDTATIVTGGNITITPTSGDLVLSAGVAVPRVTTTPSVGNLVLAAGTQRPALTASPTPGNLILSADAPTTTGGTPTSVALTPQDPASIIASI